MPSASTPASSSPLCPSLTPVSVLICSQRLTQSPETIMKCERARGLRMLGREKSAARAGDEQAKILLDASFRRIARTPITLGQSAASAVTADFFFPPASLFFSLFKLRRVTRFLSLRGRKNMQLHFVVGQKTRAIARFIMGAPGAPVNYACHKLDASRVGIGQGASGYAVRSKPSGMLGAHCNGWSVEVRRPSDPELPFLLRPAPITPKPLPPATSEQDGRRSRQSPRPIRHNGVVGSSWKRCLVHPT
ncbi:hypothetical protein L1887_57026 [Cichorium endivia]|nr:hypothetical protein L1887_57026 [Cichorium endivia]